ncbi:helix-turn-helix transcriptional regulator [Rhodopseudomonas sp. B29]|uniref:helix-turn-helix transcriptional regulator n=1 Tax=Rhodopseudomonas sp. B29 TaxID=95607 RepID=UPI000345AFE9|nr:helix-turn-helix transcriptional regulator [Rhodopseudomonas sp. B29]
MDSSRTGECSSVLAPVVLAIGQPCFPDVLMESLRAVARVGHCMVFAFDEAGAASTRCALDTGIIGIGGELGVAYSQHFYAADPNRECMMARNSARAPIILPRFSRRMYGDSYRKLFFDDAKIVDKIACATWAQDACFYVNFYRTSQQGRFAAREAEALSDLAPLLSAIIARHCQATARQADAEDNTRKLAHLFDSNARFASLTGREKQVCRLILAGYGSEAIAATLAISLHSTFTYRKRAYGKLGISSQNELFAIALSTMTLPRQLQ